MALKIGLKKQIVHGRESNCVDIIYCIKPDLLKQGENELKSYLAFHSSIFTKNWKCYEIYSIYFSFII